jgi:hypothetical protein
LSIRFLITTAVDLPTVHIAANRAAQEFPFAGFANGSEMARFQEYFLSAFAKPPAVLTDESQEAPEAQEPPVEGADAEPMPAGEEVIVNPFQVPLADKKAIKHLHQAAFTLMGLLLLLRIGSLLIQIIPKYRQDQRLIIDCGNAPFCHCRVSLSWNRSPRKERAIMRCLLDFSSRELSFDRSCLRLSKRESVRRLQEMGRLDGRDGCE